MRTIKPYIDALLKIWQENSPAARIGILLLAALCVVSIAGVGYWSIQPNYVVLVSDTDSDKVDKVIDALDKAGIEYQLSGAGGNLLVDKRDYAKARLLARKGGVDDASAFSGGNLGGAFGSPTERRNLARIQKQHNIAATIKKMTIVEHADVHLNVPDKGPFERKTSAPSASVLLTLRPGTALTDQQASSIASFVAFAVEDLRPEAVQITDKDGRSYTVPDEQVHKIASQVEYTAEAERKLARKAETQLLHFLGYGNASVQVSMDLTFSEGSKTVTKYDPEGKVASEEDLETQTTNDVEQAAVGTAGVAANLQTRNRGSSDSVQSKRENIKTSYLVPKTEEIEANSTPIRNFMTVSVLVNSGAEGVAGEDGTVLAGLDKRVADIVKNAVGFQEESDTISVEFLPFPDSGVALDPVAAPFNWQQLTSIIEKASLGVAAGLAFLMGIMLLRRFKPPQQTEDAAAGPSMDRERLESVQQLSSLIKDHPEVFTQMVQSWSGGAARDQQTPPQRKAA